MAALTTVTVLFVLTSVALVVRSLQLKREKGRTVYWRDKSMSIEREVKATAECQWCGDLASKKVKTAGEILTFGQCFKHEKDRRKKAEAQVITLLAQRDAGKPERPGMYCAETMRCINCRASVASLVKAPSMPW